MRKREQQAARSALRAAVLYARVSSKEQEQEGYSIPAQLRLLREYADQQGLQIAQEFVDVETAKTTGRPGFAAMLAYFKKNSTCRTLLVEKTDRLYRNLKDWVTIDDFRLEVHFPKENVIIGPDSRSSEKFLHGIKVLMAKNYVENLGEEASKGMREKAKNGIWPSAAPTGYQNVDGTDGHRTIIPHPVTAPVVRQIFEWFATGEYTLKDIAAKLRTEKLPFGTRQVNVSSIHAILRKRIYTGEFDWKGEVFQGTYEPLVNKATWDRVQDLLSARSELRHRKMVHDFTYTGLLQCGHCGCAMVGEIKKDRYIYYHCTRYKGKCPEPYTREEVVHAEFTDILRRLVIPEPVLKWLSAELERSTDHEERTRQQTTKSWQDECDRLQGRLDAMYEDKLDGRITPEQYDRKAKDLRSRQDALRTKIRERKSTTADLRAGFNMMRLTSVACKEFQRQSPREQRKLLGLVVDAATWNDGHLDVTLHEPFRTLLLSNSASVTKEGAEARSGPQIEAWLPGMDSNHDSRLQRPLSYH
jgi:site-specific DNA recombinase